MALLFKLENLIKIVSAGPLCLSKHVNDRRLDDTFPTFKKFNRSLSYSCEKGDPGVLEFTPNTSWPDIVYYNSFTQNNMGWKIHIVDSYTRSSALSTTTTTVLSLIIVNIILNLYL